MVSADALIFEADPGVVGAPQHVLAGAQEVHPPGLSPGEDHQGGEGDLFGVMGIAVRIRHGALFVVVETHGLK
jgi:hypothetical protein